MSYSVQQVFKKFKNSYLKNNTLSSEQSSVFNSILNCRTEVLGTRIYKCEECGKTVFAYDSCKNRHCPNCQDYKKEVWIQNHKSEILNIPYFHVVTTVPAELHAIFYHNKKKMYNLLFKAASESMIELCEDEKYLGVKVGITAMLHTWSQKGNYHPHIHMIVTGGGLDKLGKFKKSKEGYLIPVKVLSRKFRGKLLSLIKEEELEFYNEYEYLKDKKELNKYLKPLYEKEWVCYSKSPFNNVGETYEYLGRYAFRVCMSNERIVKMDETHVWFTYKDHKDRNNKKVMKVSGEEFIRRFLLHALPKSFMKVRYYGILSGKGKKEKIKLLQRLTKTANNVIEKLSKLELLNKIVGKDVTKCSECNGEMHLIRQIISSKLRTL